MLHLIAHYEINQKLVELMNDLATYYWAHEQWTEFFRYRKAARWLAGLEDAYAGEYPYDTGIQQQLATFLERGMIDGYPYKDPPGEDEWSAKYPAKSIWERLQQPLEKHASIAIGVVAFVGAVCLVRKLS